MSTEEKAFVQDLARQLSSRRALQKYTAFLLTAAIIAFPFALKWSIVHWANDLYDARYTKIEAFKEFAAEQVSQHAAINKTVDSNSAFTAQHSQSIQKLEIGLATQQETLKSISNNVTDIKEQIRKL